jgi:hypothetical protein
MLPNLRIHLTLVLIAIVGCDDAASRVAREAANRQAQQNTAMAELNKEVASGTHRLVEADSQARRDIIGVHHELQSERARLDAGRDALEQDRRRIASDRRTESLFASMAPIVGGTILLIVLLGFSWYALVAGRSADDSVPELSELLLDEVLAVDQPQISSAEPQKSLPGHILPKD